MSAILLDRIAHFAVHRCEQTALADNRAALNYLELQREIECTAATLSGSRIGLLLANGCAWAILDLAVYQRRATCIPLPSFFSDAQLQHVIDDAQLDVIITDQPARVQRLSEAFATTEITVAGQRLTRCTIAQKQSEALPSHIAKITYTSGTTGHPKGVCLTSDAIENIAIALSTTVAARHDDKALTVLPLSTLLANIAGIYAPLYSGNTSYLPNLLDCGIDGSSGVQPDLLIATLQRYQPTVTVVVPQLLKIMVEVAAQGASMPSSLRYIAVGGAPVAPALLNRARELGLPVFQGYGLSEAASVVTMNVPGMDNIASVGRPLPHIKLRIADDGEIWVSGNLFSGYLGQSCHQLHEWATGDTGFIDSDGYLHITGRKKTAFATAYGRNIAPEWIESELIATAPIAQAVLFGEGRSFNVAIVVPCSAMMARSIDSAIELLNQTLPDYARVKRWLIADEPFAARNGLANGSGALNRQAIATKYLQQLERLYAGEKLHAFP